MKEKLAEYVDLLYQSAPECFCERLVSNTFHITLHDLSNSPVLRNVAEELFENELRVIEKKREIQQQEKAILKMKSKYIFNMVDTSLVLGLYPADEAGYCRLMKLYSIFDDVKRLNYPFTPHITLAYYNINGFSSEAARRLGLIRQPKLTSHMNYTAVLCNNFSLKPITASTLLKSPLTSFLATFKIISSYTASAGHKSSLWFRP